MYCPRCGQQLPGETRFCSRCGLPMNAVTDILINDGKLPSLADNQTRPPQRGIRFAVKLIFLSLLLAPLCFGISFALDSGVPLFGPVTVFLAGLFWLIYSSMFREDPISVGWPGRKAQPSMNGTQGPLLTSPHTLNNSPARAASTGEMVAPPAITDHTTRLLD